MRKELAVAWQGGRQRKSAQADACATENKGDAALNSYSRRGEIGGETTGDDNSAE